MRNLRRRLPPINSLVVFEAAARHLSFKRAGQELNVTREAVSRQMRALEHYLGVSLFDRLHRALALTEAGARFFDVVAGSLESIAMAAEDLRPPGAPDRLVISATVALSSYWLTPRLPRFRALHPETEIRVTVSDTPLDMAANGLDVGLRYGDGRWPGLKAVHLFDVASFPVCSPGYFEQHPHLQEPEALVGHTLLNLDGIAHEIEDWAWWLKASGVPRPKGLQILGFDHYANVIQAALDGQGVALGYSGIVDELLARGSLIRPMETAHSKGLAVYLVTPQNKADGASLSAPAKAFAGWVVAEVAADGPPAAR